MSNKFNPDWLKRYHIIHDGFIDYIPDPEGTWLSSVDHDRSIMEQAAEYQEINKRLEDEISNLMVANEVLKGKWTKAEADIKSSQREYQGIISKLEADLAAARRCGSCRKWISNAFVGNGPCPTGGKDEMNRDSTCDNWEVI